MRILSSLTFLSTLAFPSLGFRTSLFNNNNRRLIRTMGTMKPPASTTEDKYTWLEDVEADECLDFAKTANAKCLEILGDPKDGPSYDRILSVLESKDRIPHVSSFGRNEQGNRVVFDPVGVI